MSFKITDMKQKHLSENTQITTLDGTNINTIQELIIIAFDECIILSNTAETYINEWIINRNYRTFEIVNLTNNDTEYIDLLPWFNDNKKYYKLNGMPLTTYRDLCRNAYYRIRALCEDVFSTSISNEDKKVPGSDKNITSYTYYKLNVLDSILNNKIKTPNEVFAVTTEVIKNVAGVFTATLADLKETRTDIVEYISSLANIKEDPYWPTEEPSKIMIQIFDKCREIQYLVWRNNERNVKVNNKFEYPDYFMLWNDQILDAAMKVQKLTSNSDVSGAVAEAALRKLIRRAIAPLEISHGTIYGMPTSPQIDGIIWDPRQCPPLIEIDDVVIITQRSLLGILEIKLSCSDIIQFGHRIRRLHNESYAISEDEYDTKIISAQGVLILSSKDEKDVASESGGSVISLFKKNGNSITTNQWSWSILFNFIFDKILEKRSFMKLIKVKSK